MDRIVVYKVGIGCVISNVLPGLAYLIYITVISLTIKVFAPHRASPKKITQNNNQGFEKSIATRTKHYPMTKGVVGDFSFEDDRRISAHSTLIGPQNVADRDFCGLLLVVPMST